MKKTSERQRLEEYIIGLKMEIQKVNSEFCSASASGSDLAISNVRNASILKVFENCKAIADYVSHADKLMAESLQRRVAMVYGSYSRIRAGEDRRLLQSWIKSELVPVVRLSESVGHLTATSLSGGDMSHGASHSWRSKQ